MASSNHPDAHVSLMFQTARHGFDLPTSPAEPKTRNMIVPCLFIYKRAFIGVYVNVL